MEGAGMGDSDLLSKMLQIEQKLFYLDLKENSRGRYLKISEKSAGSRSTIIVPLAGIVWFVDLFNYYANSSEAELSSKELQLDTKVFYFDVGENTRGRFLKVSEASLARNRSTIIVPAGSTADDGWSAFRNILVEIHEASLATPVAGSGTAAAAAVAGGEAAAPAVPAAATAAATLAAAPSAAGAADGSTAPAEQTSRVIRADNKRFYLDLGSNARGPYLKISEVAGPDRSVIILPLAAIEQFHDALTSLVEVARNQHTIGGGSVRTIAPLRKRTEP